MSVLNNNLLFTRSSVSDGTGREQKEWDIIKGGLDEGRVKGLGVVFRL